jgi:hypothetical protein
VIVNSPLVAPAGIVSVPGTDATPSLLDSMTVVPPSGDAPVRVAVPCAVEPPVTVSGCAVTRESAGAGLSDDGAGVSAGVSISRVGEVGLPPHEARPTRAMRQQLTRSAALTGRYAVTSAIVLAELSVFLSLDRSATANCAVSGERGV